MKSATSHQADLVLSSGFPATYPAEAPLIPAPSFQVTVECNPETDVVVADVLSQQSAMTFVPCPTTPLQGMTIVKVFGQKAVFSDVRLPAALVGRRVVLRFGLCRRIGGWIYLLEGSNVLSSPIVVTDALAGYQSAVPTSMGHLQLTASNPPIPASSVSAAAPLASPVIPRAQNLGMGQMMYQTADPYMQQRPSGYDGIMSSAAGYMPVYQLDIARGPDRVHYKGSRIRIELNLVHLSGPVVSFTRTVRVVVSLEDGEGHPVESIQRGPLAGEPILAQSEFKVPISSTQSLLLGNIRIREVARNHTSRGFQIVVTLPDLPFVSPARTRPFMVRSERLRSPSYAAQLESQRVQRKQKETLKKEQGDVNAANADADAKMDVNQPQAAEDSDHPDDGGAEPAPEDDTHAADADGSSDASTDESSDGSQDGAEPDQAEHEDAGQESEDA